MWPGSMSANPSRAPTRAPAIECPDRPRPASASSVIATRAVSGLGIRPVRKSMAAAAPEAVTTTASTTRSDVRSGNGLPQHGVDLVAHRGHRADRHEGDEGAEHRVFEQVLTILATDRPNECNKAIHDGHSHSWGAQGSK